jgi:ethanolamine-phosphate cytidylyltransferase
MKKVYVDMVGDLFHQGHVELLKAARAFGDYLLVGVLSDQVVSAYKRQPIMTMEERISVIQACRYVDEVLPEAPDIVTSEFLRTHGIALVIHGSDISEEVIKVIYNEPQQEGKFKLVKRTGAISTTELINRIITRHCPAEQNPGQRGVRPDEGL